ncbi:hypothetical protein [Dyella koreensis]|uniref:Flagellar protein FlgJ N-terminal domain-containing protein n=1 Tax=Dyella koreensis TaxID=311235 RepID=A0ABW8K9I7_9GAMM
MLQTNAFRRTDALSAASSGDTAHRQKLEDAAVKFEGMFIAHLLNEMRKTTTQFAGPAGAGGQDTALLEHAYRLVADDIAAQRAFGIADSIVTQMRAAQSGSPST